MDRYAEEHLTERLVRWGGAATIVGALLMTVGIVIGTVAFSGQELPEIADETMYFVATGLGLLGAIPLVFGLIALYRPQIEQAGAWGVAGFVGAMLGTLFMASSLWVQTMVVPSVGAHAPGFLELVSDGEVTGPLPVAMMVPLLIETLGFLFFGIATYRAGVFSKPTGVALILGALLHVVPIGGVTLVPLLLALMWMGYRVASRRVTVPSGHPHTRQVATASAG